jgi:hypothetical protein
LDDSHADIQNVLHELFTAAELALLLLLLIVASSENSHAKHLQALGLNSNTNDLAVTLLTEALLEESLDNSLQLSLNATLQDQWCLLMLNTGIIAAWVSGINARNFLTREQRL